MHYRASSAAIRDDPRKFVIALALRVALACQLLAASYEVLFRGGLTSSAPKHETAAWMMVHVPGPLGTSLAALIAAGAGLLLSGFRLRLAAVGVCSLLLLYALLHLWEDPFYNLTGAIVPLLLMAGLLATLRSGVVSLGSEFRDTACLGLRALIGPVFIAQGFRNTFLHGGILSFARRDYVLPFQHLLPVPALWIAGVSNPPWELLGGLLLTLGLFTVESAAAMTLFLLIIIFGHCIQDLGAATAGMRDYALMNFAAVLGVIALARRTDRWALDRLIHNRKTAEPRPEKAPLQRERTSSANARPRCS